jgi:hypothetical protein
MEQVISIGLSSAFAMLSSKFDILVAMFVLWLAYRLIRFGLQRVPQSSDRFDWQTYSALVIPGLCIAIFGMTFVLRPDTITLALYFVTLTIVVGLGFAILGYRLFVRGVLGSSDVEAVWKG